METALKPKWYGSREGALHLAVAAETTADGTVYQGACGKWFTPSGAYDDSHGVPLGAADEICMATAMGVS